MPKPTQSVGEERIPVSIAIREAKKSPMDFRVGAVLFRGREILGTGFSHHVRCFSENKQIGIHAEQATLVGIRHDIIRGADILIIRINPQGILMPISPCIRCRNLLTRKGIRKVYYWSSSMDLKAYIP